MYQTKDSGERAQFESGMVRDTQNGKPRFDLVFPKNVPYQHQMLTRFAELMARGASKYEERNWEKAFTEAELDRARSSALRHMIQWFLGENDEDHAAAVMFNLMAAEYVKYRMPIEADAKEEYDQPLLCETLGQHACSRHPLGFPTATAGLYVP